MNNLRPGEVNYILKDVNQLESKEFRDFLLQNLSKILLSKISEDKFKKRKDCNINQSFNLYPKRFYDIVDYCLIDKLDMSVFNDGGYQSIVDNIITSWINYVKKSPFKCYNLIRAYIIWKEDI